MRALILRAFYRMRFNTCPNVHFKPEARMFPYLCDVMKMHSHCENYSFCVCHKNCFPEIAWLSVVRIRHSASCYFHFYIEIYLEITLRISKMVRKFRDGNSNTCATARVRSVERSNDTNPFSLRKSVSFIAYCKKCFLEIAWLQVLRGDTVFRVIGYSLLH